jgi:hypothetical protein
MSITAKIIIDVLRTAPDGMTTKEVSEKLGVNPYDAGGRLSKLAAYGKIDKVKGSSASGKIKWRCKPERDGSDRIAEPADTSSDSMEPSGGSCAMIIVIAYLFAGFVPNGKDEISYAVAQ